MDIYSEYLQLARLAMSGRVDDVLAILRKTARQSAAERPEFSTQLKETLNLQEPTILRKASIAPSTQKSDVNELFVRNKEKSNRITPVWSGHVGNSLHEIVLQQKNRKKLEKANILPSRSVLFVGPPGVGKTLAAGWLADQLDRTLLTINLAALMSSYLGKTGSNLSKAIDQASSNQNLLFIDEVDSVGKSRGDSSDVGELKRLVNVLLQSIDNWSGAGFLVCATNHPELLDKALWRRFDEVIEFPLPTIDEVFEYVSSQFSKSAYSIDTKLTTTISATLAGKSFSDCQNWISSCIRKSITRDCKIDDVLIAELVLMLEKKSVSEKIMVAELMRDQKISQREISKSLGMSRDTLRKYLGKSSTKGSK